MRDSDNSIMAQVRDGHVAKLAVLFERHHRSLFRYFLALNRDKGLSEDLTQEVFVRLLRYRSTFDASQPFLAWMYQIARNASVDVARRRRGEVVGIDEYLGRGVEPADMGATPEQGASDRQNAEFLRRALDRLSPEKKELLVLARFQGLRYEEIARIVGCEVPTLKVRVFRAMKALEEAYWEVAGRRPAKEA